jgi:hypothetical protein
MAGLPGSGKTTLSRALTDRGFLRLFPDEEMYNRHGVYGCDFPRGTFPVLYLHAADSNSIYFAESDLIRYRSRFVPPEPDEPHLLYNGDPDSVVKALDQEAQRGKG